jgi:hypothetical protein
MRRTLLGFLISFALLASLLAPRRAVLSQAVRQDRVVTPIAGSPLVWLEGNRRPLFVPENDAGPVSDSQRIENITLVFKPTPDQEANLATLLDEQQDRSSPRYHQWLTPEQFADQFGLTTTDVAAVAAWLESEGFTITQAARSRRWISFTGTAAQVRSAFQAEIHNYSLAGKSYYAIASEPAVPAVLADVVLGFRGLDNYGLKPRGIFRQIKAASRPNFTSSLTENTYVDPADFAVIYDLNNLYSAGIDGTGQTIAVMGQTDLYGNLTDVTAFRAAAGLPANSPQVTLIPGASDPGVVQNDIEEASLDVEWSGAVARNAQIIFVNGGSGSVLNALQYTIDQGASFAPVISISYGDCEADWSTSGLANLKQLGEQANTQGQTIVAAAGDSGAADCDVPASPTATVTMATHGLAVDAPASSPYVTAMGGSEFNEGSGNYWAASTGTDILTSALSYIPEMAWNDTLSPENSDHELSAGGGGASAYFTKPSWQTGTGVPADGMRDVPDLALNSSPVHDPLLICVQGSCVNGFRSSSQLLSVVGGTSAAAPTFAGIVALINQQMSTPKGQGNVNPTLYAMAGATPAAFHDITTGSNIVPCQSGSTDCPASGQIGYSAGPGYDQATGLGSIDAYNLVTAWGSTVPGNLPAPSQSTPTNGAAAVGQSPDFTWTSVSGNAGYRLMIATSPAALPTIPATGTCSSCTLTTTTAANVTSYTPTSPLAAATYYWQVQAVEPSTSAGTAAWSSIFSFTTASPTLAAPTLTAPANGAAAVAVQPTFAWTTVTGNAGYRILVSPVQSALPTNSVVGTCGGCVAGVTTSAASHVPPANTLAGSTTYYWEVQALAAGGGLNGTWSAISAFTTITTDFSLSASPSSLTIAPGSSGTSTVSLTSINGFSATPAFTCSVSSSLAGVTCSVGTYNTTNNTAVVSVTTSSSAKLYPPSGHEPKLGAPWAIVLAFLGIVLVGLARNQRIAQVALGAALCAFLLVAVSCGSSSGSGGGGQSQSSPESGTVTVTGTSGSVTHTVQISISVS